MHCLYLNFFAIPIFKNIFAIPILEQPKQKRLGWGIICGIQHRSNMIFKCDPMLIYEQDCSLALSKQRKKHFLVVVF